jgi:hypothetical protein
MFLPNFLPFSHDIAFYTSTLFFGLTQSGLQPMIYCILKVLLDPNFKVNAKHPFGYSNIFIYAYLKNKKYKTKLGRHVYPQTVVSVSWHYKNPTKLVDLVQSGPHHHHIEN